MKKTKYSKEDLEFIKSWGIESADANDAIAKRVEAGEMVQVWVGCDTGRMQCSTLHQKFEHGEKYEHRGVSVWVSGCDVCDRGLQKCQVVAKWFDGHQIQYCVDAAEAARYIADEEQVEIAKRLEKTRQKDAEMTRRQKLIDLAKATGLKQRIKEWSEDCDGSTDECNVDHMIEYAMPDGRVEVERVHTY